MPAKTETLVSLSDYTFVFFYNNKRGRSRTISCVKQRNRVERILNDGLIMLIDEIKAIRRRVHHLILHGQ